MAWCAAAARACGARRGVSRTQSNALASHWVARSAEGAPSAGHRAVSRLNAGSRARRPGPRLSIGQAPPPPRDPLSTHFPGTAPAPRTPPASPRGPLSACLASLSAPPAQGCWERSPQGTAPGMHSKSHFPLPLEGEEQEEIPPAPGPSFLLRPRLGPFLSPAPFRLRPSCNALGRGDGFGKSKFFVRS